MSKIVVFGANGFIGQNLVKSLARASGHSIKAFDRFSAYQRDAHHPFDHYENVEMVIGDFLNRNDVASVLNGAEYIFHLVSATTPATSNNDPFIDIDTNIRGSVELFDLSAEQGVKKVIFLSSGGTVYGDLDSDKIDELNLPQPRSPYGISKLTIEHYLRYYRHIRGLDYIVYRVANPYGPGQNIHGKQGVIPIFMNKFLSGEPLTIYGTGNMVRDYIYIDDLIAMIMGSFDRPNKYSEYNLGSGQGATVNDVVASIEKSSSKTAKRESIPTPSTFVHRSVLDINRFINEFGITPKISIDEGMRKTWDYVKELTK